MNQKDTANREVLVTSSTMSHYENLGKSRAFCAYAGRVSERWLSSRVFEAYRNQVNG